MMIVVIITSMKVKGPCQSNNHNKSKIKLNGQLPNMPKNRPRATGY